MSIWVEGKKYEIDTMPNNVLALYLRKYIKVDWENTWLPETNKKESYAILNEAARRLVKGATMEQSANALAELATKTNFLVLDRDSYDSYESFAAACETKNRVAHILNELSDVVFDGIICHDGNGTITPSIIMKPNLDSLVSQFYRSLEIAEKGY